MKHEPSCTTVAGTQNVSRMCFVCGTQNNISLKAQFFSLEDGRLCAEFIALDEHQSYPGRTHGGVVSAILDETIGRVIQVEKPDAFGVTIELNTKYRKPVPLGVPLRVIAWMTKETARAFEGEGELLLPDGTVAAQGSARYLKLDVDQISDEGLSEEEWYADIRPYPNQILI